MALWAAAVLYNGVARYEEAASAARQAASDPLNWWSMWVLPELVEAAVRGGEAELARDALERLAETTQPCRTEFALGIEARCRALLSDGASADALYREAIERLGAPGSVRSSPARIFSTGSGCAARIAGSTRASSCARLTRCWRAIGMEAFAERARRELSGDGREGAQADRRRRATI